MQRRALLHAPTRPVACSAVLCCIQRRTLLHAATRPVACTDAPCCMQRRTLLHAATHHLAWAAAAACGCSRNRCVRRAGSRAPPPCSEPATSQCLRWLCGTPRQACLYVPATQHHRSKHMP
eukprot:363873-Chlamydomonas_euryale.AAC.22